MRESGIFRGLFLENMLFVSATKADFEQVLC